MFEDGVIISITNTDGQEYDYEYIDVLESDGVKYAVLGNGNGLRIMEIGESPLDLKDVPAGIAQKIFKLYCKPE